jgi:D-sedoheptulose 7-phosphate isomerase
VHNIGVIEEAIKKRYRQLLSIDSSQVSLLEDIASAIAKAISGGGCVFAFGNGGSAAEAQHFTTELVGRFKNNRKSLPAISLCADTSALTAIANDFGFESIFSRQVESLANTSDIVVGFSTSGRSPNVLAGLAEAKKRGSKTVLFTGNNQHEISPLADLVMQIGGTETAIVQECHLMIIHILCELIEDKLELSQSQPSHTASEVVYDRDLAKFNFPKDKSIVWVNGCFDILHEGHLRLINSGGSAGEYLIVGINSDESIRQLKGEDRPFISENARAQTLLQLPFIDLVVIFSDSNPLSVLKIINPTIVIKGQEYKDQDFPEKKYLQEIGCKLVFMQQIPNLSTSLILQTLKAKGEK